MSNQNLVPRTDKSGSLGTSDKSWGSGSFYHIKNQDPGSVLSGSFSGSFEGIILSNITTSSITNFDTEVSRSAALSGFGAGGGVSSYNDLTDIPSGLISSSVQVTDISVSNITNFSQEVSASAAFYGFSSSGSEIATNWVNIPGKPSGIVSSSNQIENLGFITSSGVPNLIGTNVFSSSLQVDYNNIQNTPSLFDGIYSSLTSVPIGILSSSSQISNLSTSSITNFNTEVSRSVADVGFGTGDYLLLSNVPNNIVSSSAQINYNNILNKPIIFSGSYLNLSNIPVGIVSSSVQIDYNSISNIPINLYSSSAQITGLATSSITNFNTEVSRSAALNGFGVGGGGTSDYTELINVPSGILSSSTQIENLGFITSSGVPDLAGSGVYSSSLQITGLATSSITNFDTAVSASVSSFGFGSGGGTFATVIAEQVITTPTSSIVFTSLDLSSYDKVEIELNHMMGTNGSTTTMYMRWNDLSGAYHSNIGQINQTAFNIGTLYVTEEYRGLGDMRIVIPYPGLSNNRKRFYGEATSFGATWTRTLSAGTYEGSLAEASREAAITKINMYPGAGNVASGSHIKLIGYAYA